MGESTTRSGVHIAFIFTHTHTHQTPSNSFSFPLSSFHLSAWSVAQLRTCACLNNLTNKWAYSRYFQVGLIGVGQNSKLSYAFSQELRNQYIMHCECKRFHSISFLLKGELGFVWTPPNPRISSHQPAPFLYISTKGNNNGSKTHCEFWFFKWLLWVPFEVLKRIGHWDFLKMPVASL